MKRCLFLAMAACAWGAAAPLPADNSPTTRLSIKGLDAVALALQPIDAAAEKDGLSRKQLQDSAAARLQRAGIRLLQPREQLDCLRRPQLLLSVTTARLDTSEYLYSVRLELVQWVASLDDPTLAVTAAIPIPAATWSPPSVLGITPVATLQRDVEGAVLAMVDEFVDAHEKANPRQTALRHRSGRN